MKSRKSTRNLRLKMCIRDSILGRSYELLSDLQPEGYLVLGDTNSCLSAISAKPVSYTHLDVYKRQFLP